ncbi:carboxylesterase family protein [Breoghania sp.]|uniref:carboxylesterase family protein n=1 Tax=Breoghania sp. TaxID=2065378 RepID=UPI0026216701|nr:carboxylesterase family protein [Breoghania sp.]MDJ0929829.1 carboxylesterase family protein [Breoghania sp.]
MKKDLGEARWKELKPYCYDYGRDNDDAFAEQIATEWFAGINSRAITQTHADHGNPVYAYPFAWVPKAKRGKVRGAIHTSEIPYVFGHVAANTSADPESRKLSDALADRWVAFARTGSPQIKNAPAWRGFYRQGEHIPADWREWNSDRKRSCSTVDRGPDETSSAPTPLMIVIEPK